MIVVNKVFVLLRLFVATCLPRALARVRLTKDGAGAVINEIPFIVWLLLADASPAYGRIH